MRSADRILAHAVCFTSGARYDAQDQNAISSQTDIHTPQMSMVHDDFKIPAPLWLLEHLELKADYNRTALGMHQC